MARVRGWVARSAEQRDAGGGSPLPRAGCGGAGVQPPARSKRRGAQAMNPPVSAIRALFLRSKL